MKRLHCLSFCGYVAFPFDTVWFRPICLIFVHPCVVGAFDTGLGLCEACAMTCNTCHGPDLNHCLSCDFGHWLQDGYCVSSCKIGHYPLEVSDKCSLQANSNRHCCPQIFNIQLNFIR